MYLDKVYIDNYGSIDKFEYNFRFNDNGRPVPIIIVGTNGSGKTLAMINIVDALIEAKRETFPNGITETKGNNRYKVGSKTYIKSGAIDSCVKINFKDDAKQHSYTDCMSNNPEQTFGNVERKNFMGINDVKFKESGFYNNHSFDLDEKVFQKNIYCYFPVDRYYVPKWFNDENLIQYDTTKEDKYVGKSNVNIIKKNLINEIKHWLRECFLSTTNQIVIQNQQVLHQSTILTNTQSLITQILRIVKPTISISIPSYKNNNIQLSYTENKIKRTINDLQNLSSGEIMLMGIFLSILKDYDVFNNPNSLDEIKGIVLIDEIDLNLHISQQQNILPQLVKLFPNIQFIIATHSPFFVKGMHDTFGNNFDLVNMPSGEKLNNIYDFSEIQEAIKALSSENDYLHKVIAELRNSTKPILITEGKTDIEYIKFAYEKNGKVFPQIEIKSADGDIKLREQLRVIKNVGLSQKVIGLFDRDNLSCLSTADFNIKEQKFYELSNNTFAFAIPLPQHRENAANQQLESISIEHYLTDKELRTVIEIDGIKRRLYSIDEFNKKFPCKHKTKALFCSKAEHHKKSPIAILDECEDAEKVRDKDGIISYNISKQKFVECIKNNVDGFDKFNFSKYVEITNIIDEILVK